MPNIAITTYCNLKCPYCFTQQMFNEKNIKNITVEQFNKILKWIESWEKNNHSRIGIIGGEPLLHPEFSTLMKYLSDFCYKYNTFSLLFTNGLLLNDTIISHIPDNMKIIINYNDFSIYSINNNYDIILNKNLQTLNELNWYNNSRVILGLNLCQEINDYNFFKNIILKYPFKEFRLAVAFPGNNINLNTYYLKMKNKFLDIINFANDNYLKINMDCRIPITYFSKEEQIKIFNVCNKEKYLKDCSHPQHEIMPDFTMTTCFANYKVINCNNFKNFEQYWIQKIEKNII